MYKTHIYTRGLHHFCGLSRYNKCPGIQVILSNRPVCIKGIFSNYILPWVRLNEMFFD